VPRKIFVGIRIDSELKKRLEEIAGGEERSVSQVCERLLRGAVAAYKKVDTNVQQRHSSRDKHEKYPE
jgi:predicted transcriptional regulator